MGLSNQTHPHLRSTQNLRRRLVLIVELPYRVKENIILLKTALFAIFLALLCKVLVARNRSARDDLT